MRLREAFIKNFLWSIKDYESFSAIMSRLKYTISSV